MGNVPKVYGEVGTEKELHHDICKCDKCLSKDFELIDKGNGNCTLRVSFGLEMMPAELNPNAGILRFKPKKKRNNI